MGKPYQLILAAIVLLTGLTVCAGWITGFIAPSNEAETVVQAMAEPPGIGGTGLGEADSLSAVSSNPGSSLAADSSSSAPDSSAESALDSSEEGGSSAGSSLPESNPSQSETSGADPSQSSSGQGASSQGSGPPPSVSVVSDPGPMSATSISTSEPSQSEGSSSSAPPASSVPSSSEPSSSVPSSSAPPEPPASSEEVSEPESSLPEEPSGPSGGQALRVSLNGVVTEGDTYDILCRIVEAEVGETYHTETLKAQTVAVYSYILYENAAGRTPSLPSRQPSQKTKAAVSAVFGQVLRYNGSVAFTPYHASSSGYTNSSAEIWGGSYPYLVSVESSYDPVSFYKNQTVALSASTVKAKLEAYLGVALSGDPEDWFGEINTNQGGYVTSMTVYDSSGGAHSLTGRQMRENVLGYSIRSHAFTLEIQGGQIVFTTNGYGHGVGMSQTGANGYAVNEGWSYSQILSHYYPGTVLG